MSRKLIIFDFDGTIVDSKPQFAAGLKEFSETRGLPHDIEKQSRNYIDPINLDLGWGLSLVDQLPVHDAFHDFIITEQIVHKRFLGELFDGVRDVIRELEAEYDLGLITVRDRATTLATLEYHGLDNAFPKYRTRCCATDRKYAIKPSPDALYCLIRETGHDARDVMMIGDTTSDIDMANAANVKSIAALWGVHDHDKLAASNPSVMLDNIRHVPDAIKKIWA